MLDKREREVMRKKCCVWLLLSVLIVGLCACSSDFKNKSDEKMSEEVRILQRKIDKALESEPSYEDLIEIRELYEDLLNAEQEQVTNYDRIEGMFSLSYETVACIYATNKLKENLKNPSTLNVISASCVKDSSFETLCIKIDYTADNNVGGTVEDEYYCMVDVPIKDENGNWSCKLDDLFEKFYNLELLNGALRTSSRISSQDKARKEYNRYSDDATEVNAVQIMDNLNLSITDLPHTKS